MFDKESLLNIRVAVLAADGVEQVELTRPRKKLLKAGAIVDIVSIRPGSIRGVHLLEPADSFEVDRTIDEVDVDDYDALLIPGGLMSPDLLRQSDRVLNFVRNFDRAYKPIAAICHGPWILVSADVVDGRRLTSWPSVRDDIENAGGTWENMSVVRDDNLITSRGPQDLFQFNRALIQHFNPEGEAREHRTAVPAGGATITGLALAAIGFGLRDYQKSERANRRPAHGDSLVAAADWIGISIGLGRVLGEHTARSPTPRGRAGAQRPARRPPPRLGGRPDVVSRGHPVAAGTDRTPRWD